MVSNWLPLSLSSQKKQILSILVERVPCRNACFAVGCWSIFLTKILHWLNLQKKTWMISSSLIQMHNPRLRTRPSRSAIRVEGWQRVLFTRPSLHCQNNWHHSWTISTSSMNIRYMKAVLEYLVESAILQMKRHSSIHVVPVMSVMQNSHETNNAIKATINDTRTNDFEQQRRIEKSWYQIAILGIYVIIHNQAILVPMTTCFSICFSLQTDPTYAVHVKDANKTQHPPCPLSLAK